MKKTMSLWKSVYTGKVYPLPVDWQPLPECAHGWMPVGMIEVEE